MPFCFLCAGAIAALMLNDYDIEKQTPTRAVPIISRNPIDSKVIRWLNETVGVEGRDWSLERAYLARRPVVMLRTQYQEELFRTRWCMICL